MPFNAPILFRHWQDRVKMLDLFVSTYTLFLPRSRRSLACLTPYPLRTLSYPQYELVFLFILRPGRRALAVLALPSAHSCRHAFDTTIHDIQKKKKRARRSLTLWTLDSRIMHSSTLGRTWNLFLL